MTNSTQPPLCAQPLPPLAQQGIAAFNAGEFYAQHDHFEALWAQTPGPERDLYQGILQIGVGYYQLQRGNWRGAVKMLRRGLRWLNALPSVCQGVDVAGLRADAAAVEAALVALGPHADLTQFDAALLRPVRLVTP